MGKTLRPLVHPISYDYAGAAEATGLSESTIKIAVRDGDLTPRYWNTKPVIPADELRSWVMSLPAERPGA